MSSNEFGLKDDSLAEFLPTILVPPTNAFTFSDVFEEESRNQPDEEDEKCLSPVLDWDTADVTFCSQTFETNDTVVHIPDEVSVEAKCITPPPIVFFIPDVEEQKPSPRKRRLPSGEQRPRKQLRLHNPCLPGTDQEIPLEEVTVDLVNDLKRTRKLRHFWEGHAELLLFRMLLDLLRCKTQPEVAILDNIFHPFWHNFYPDEYKMVKDRLEQLKLPDQMPPEKGNFFMVSGQVPYSKRLNRATNKFPKKNGVAAPAPPLEAMTPEQLDEYRDLDSYRFFLRAHAKYLLLDVLLRFNQMSPTEKTVLSKHCYKYWHVFYHQLVY